MSDVGSQSFTPKHSAAKIQRLFVSRSLSLLCTSPSEWVAMPIATYYDTVRFTYDSVAEWLTSMLKIEAAMRRMTTGMRIPSQKLGRRTVSRRTTA
ncbi:hypothetical protein AVT10_15440 [Sphingomonas hankookensis]|uniref:Uncharacterized protein n=1 Tax=Sphingomonas hankookensis TaxID=563996 RepID=A0ABR5YBQ1_9SPHN|nr:hypothetical protein AVT10_15440 [Sphingomonas hankookensis]